MTLAAAESVTYTYPRSLEPALADVSVHVRPREFCLLSGPSGGGKSTLLRLFNGLIPQFHGGIISGRVNVAGFDAIRTSTRQLATVAGMVFQSPEAQAVAETVVDEVAFAMEQRGITRAEMVRRMDLVLAEMGIGHLRHRRLATLSGGERQRVAVASVLALEPAMLLLDEPTSQLDEFGAAALLRMVVGLQESRGIAVLVAEHRLERILPSATRVINVVAGRAMSLAPIDALSALDDVPPAAGLSRLVGLAPRLTLEETRAALPRGLAARPRSDATPGDVLLAVDGLAVDLGGQRVLRDISMALREGEIVALIGQNGSGKSTFFRALTGLARAGAGSVAFPAAGRDQPRSTREITGRAGLVPQIHRSHSFASRCETNSPKRLPFATAIVHRHPALPGRSKHGTSPSSPPGTRVTSRWASSSVSPSQQCWRTSPASGCSMNPRGVRTGPPGCSLQDASAATLRAGALPSSRPTTSSPQPNSLPG